MTPLIEQGISKMSGSGKRGRWKPGESGNPAGRRPGSGKVAELRESIAEHIPEIVSRLVEAAKGGDVGAARTWRCHATAL